MNDENKIFSDKAFDCLDTKNKEALSELYASLKDKSAKEALPILLTFKLPENKKLTATEKKAMIDAIVQNSPPENKKTLEKLLEMLNIT